MLEILYTVCADDTIFFIQNRDSVIELLNTFDKFFSILGLKPNKWKLDILWIGILKGVKNALCGLKSLNLENKTMKILGCHYPYNKKIQQEEKFRSHITKIKNAMKMWKLNK